MLVLLTCVLVLVRGVWCLTGLVAIGVCWFGVCGYKFVVFSGFCLNSGVRIVVWLVVCLG